jgi:hypothetical protein
MLNKTILLLTVISLFITCKSSKVNSDAYRPLEKSLLWEITGKGLKKPSYLYGTIHIIPGEDYFLPKGTLASIDKSEAMFFEIDMKMMSDPSSLFGIMGKLFMKDNLSLKNLLNESDYKLVSDYFSDMGLPIFMLEKIKPMFLSAFAMIDMNPKSMEEGKVKSYEMEFYEIAQDKNMPTGGLETIEFQISVFDSIPYDDQAKMLVETIKTSSTDNDEMKKMVDLYKKQDIDGMITMMGEGQSDLGAHEDILLTKRNKNWISTITEQSLKQPTFYAVGAGHLAGKNGVIHLLRNAGFVVKPVN